jgi:hypothetical protein
MLNIGLVERERVPFFCIRIVAQLRRTSKECILRLQERRRDFVVSILATMSKENP